MAIVSDPLKQVTDPVLLSHLVKQGIDPDSVEFYRDYAVCGKGSIKSGVGANNAQ